MSKKICIVSPSLKMGGIERALTVLANYFAKQGNHVSFISAQGGEQFYTLHPDIHLFAFKAKRGKGILGKIVFYFHMILFVRKTIKKQNPDRVLSFGDAFNPLVLLALLGTQYPVFISDRTSPDFRFNTVIRFGKKWLYPKSSGFIAQTQRAAEYKKKHFGNRLRIKIIPNAIKETRVYDVPRTEQILCVGRLSVEKGQDRLISAFSKIAAETKWKLVLAGDGPMRQSLEALAKELQLGAQVVFLGKVQNVDQLLSESAIFVLPSRLEGFPNALVEAMAAGLPCVCFDSIPVAELMVSGKEGIVVPENNIDLLAETLKTLINNPEMRQELGYNAQKIKDKLAVETIGKQFFDFMFEQKG